MSQKKGCDLYSRATYNPGNTVGKFTKILHNYYKTKNMLAEIFYKKIISQQSEANKPP